MQLVAELPAAPKDRPSDISDKAHSKLAKLAKAQNADAANSGHACTASKVEDDVEDMWDNMPI